MQGSRYGLGITLLFAVAGAAVFSARTSAAPVAEPAARLSCAEYGPCLDRCFDAPDLQRCVAFCRARVGPTVLIAVDHLDACVVERCATVERHHECVNQACAKERGAAAAACGECGEAGECPPR